MWPSYNSNLYNFLRLGKSPPSELLHENDLEIVNAETVAAIDETEHEEAQEENSN